MREIDYKKVIELIDSDTLKFYNFYNLDLDLSLYYTANYYLNYQEPSPEELEQKLIIGFLDIEVYQQNRSIEFDFVNALHPISAVTYYCYNTYHAYFLDLKNFQLNTEELEKQFHQELVQNNYITEDQKLKIYTFTDELELLKSLWNKIYQDDPTVLAGWNSSKFDFPYIYNRLCILAGEEEANKIISRFGLVKKYKNEIDIPDLNLVDLMYLYMPREDGGRNYGVKQPSYSLEYISDVELKLRKFEYKSTNLNLNEFYENNPSGYLFYNIIDTCLCVNLDKKLNHIQFHNSIRRKMKSPFSKSLIGSSALFDSFILATLNKKYRFGVVSQHRKTITVEDLEKIPVFQVISKSPKKLTRINISSDDYLSYVQKFKGGFVRKPEPKVINDGTIFSLDASSMYPNIMLQNNISFDTFVARILPPSTYKFLEFLNSRLGKPISSEFFSTIFNITSKYIKSESNNQTEFLNVTDEFSKLYFILAYLGEKIFESKLTLEEIFNPQTDKARVILSFYLIHFLDLLANVHSESLPYNPIVMTYLFDEKNLNKKFSHAYVILDAMSEKERIEKFSIDRLVEEIFKKYIVTISGACFLKHQDKLGLFTDTIEKLAKERKLYRNEMSKYSKDSEDYNKFDRLQKTIKVLMNSIYGVAGLKSFRFSNFHIANSITTQGQFNIKLMQYITEKYLENKFHERV